MRLFPADGVAPAPAPHPPALVGPAPHAAPPHLPGAFDWNLGPAMIEGMSPEQAILAPLIPDENRADRKHRQPFSPRNILRRRSQVPHAPAEVAPAVPAIQSADRPNLPPQGQAPRPVPQAPQAQAQPYVNPRAVFGQPFAPADQPDVGLWSMMYNLEPPMDAMGRLLDNYRQGELPQASPVGNGQIGDANQIDHRPIYGLVDGQAMNDGMFGWHAVLPLGNFGDPPALDFDNLPRFDGLAPVQLPAGDYDWAWPDLNFGPAVLGDQAPFGGPAPFGFDDLAFR